MGLGNKLIISGTGYPGTTKTFRFMEESYREPLEALAQLAGDKTIVTGVVISTVNNAQVVSDGFITYDGEIIPFVGGNFASTITIIENIENVSYNTDANDDTILDNLPAYRTIYATCGSGGTGSIDVFNFADLTRLKTIKELSALPPNVLTFLRKGRINISQINQTTVLDVSFPDIGTANYMVVCTSEQHDNDNIYEELRIQTAEYTATGFKAIVIANGYVPSASTFLNYTIIPL